MPSFHRNSQGKISMTKFGILLAGIGTALITNSVLPEYCDAYLKTLISIGGVLTALGGRDAMDKIGQPNKKSSEEYGG